MKLLALIFASGIAFAQFSPAPSPPAPFVAGNSPSAVVAGYFNGDALVDLAVANQLDNTVTVLLSDGKGGYQKGGTFKTGASPSAMAVADFDKDGNADLAVANEIDGTVTVLLGDGAGGVKSTLGPFTAGKSPDAIAIADFNGDFRPDIVVANRNSNSVTVLLNGTAGFQQAPGSPFPVGNGPSSVAAGDFNGDGKTDLAVTNEFDNTVTILIGNGAGGFTPAASSPFNTGLNPSFVLAGDWNGDGNLDLAVANLTGNNLTMLAGNGAGYFAPVTASPFGTGHAPVSIAAADFNGDGFTDLAVANSGDNTVTVLLGNGAAGFKSATGSPYAGGATPSSLAVGDFNQDGKLDIAVADHTGNQVSILLSAFIVAPTLVSAANYSSAAIAVGSIVSIFGNYSIAAPVLGNGMTCAGGFTVTLTDFSGAKTLMPLFYVGPGQINAQIPPDGATGAATWSIASAPQCGSAPVGLAQKGSITLTAVAPALFSANGSGKGVAAAQVVSALTPAIVKPVFNCSTTPCVPASGIDVTSGTWALVLYGTGIRNRGATAATVTVGGQTLNAFYAGMTPGLLGEDQVNVSLPASLAGAGTVYVIVSLGSATSNQVTMCIDNPPYLPSICP